ncbi:MAG: GNAT family N-acetyltransferase [Alphaproteobacteria bacterium]
MADVWLRFSWHLPGAAFIAPAPAGYEIRAANEDECEAVVSAALAAYETDETWVTMMGRIRERLSARIRATLGTSGTRYAVAVKDGEIAGVSAASLERHDGHNLITGVCVAPAHQGRGLARSLLCDNLIWLRDQGLEEAQVFTDPRAVAAKRVYPMFGARVDEAPEYRAPEAA